ncbi:hypothetical protein FHS27_005042 [Rhodopirellula rubra]|uniref:Uncharacterized protein n=1 Tax=Aporhodopirellula rubra TaxID=980271 RepID=A0A7W5E2V6_9BACT|nr:hypothetical protein [Aporhodopirellula rubra]
MIQLLSPKVTNSTAVSVVMFFSAIAAFSNSAVEQRAGFDRIRLSSF